MRAAQTPEGAGVQKVSGLGILCSCGPVHCLVFREQPIQKLVGRCPSENLVDRHAYTQDGIASDIHSVGNLGSSLDRVDDQTENPLAAVLNAARNAGRAGLP